MEDLVKKHPRLSPLLLIKIRLAPSEIYGEQTQIYLGEEAILEGVLDYEFSLSPSSLLSTESGAD